ncbi:alpha-amylase family glycosyl hydrolase [Bacillus sp. DX1.1]|uniref:alpha-amylase family glycosyl hydrolase n=1 Tax=unclassified Bacillus (in: firmicutes) TaxID=185979 RepID=UPI0025708731|nr:MULTISPECIES: alpha-amylase family glycosyl hydrolase [unclassified Bacillus (in: firmicutes)]MDM5153808.1 alpha-amylase family glycosyl hydrolase [Bacillus sp. DX1.1]WJE82744.1 alpha-amylase family glycosyl hydrolase [Bacillus sp. DX3.1]
MRCVNKIGILFLQLEKNWGIHVNRIWKRGVLVCFCMMFVLLVPMQALAEEKRKWQDEVVYSIMIDRFNNGDAKNDKQLDVNNLQAYQGGDIQGIIKRLDYIQEMGFTAIMLSPLVKSETYDGYGAGDLQKVNEHFGSLQDVKQLVREAHKRDMKVVFQFVVEKEEEALIDSINWWIKEADMDGSYFIHSEEISPAFLNDMKQSVQVMKKDFFIMNEGETDLSAVQNDYYKRITDVFSKPSMSIQPLYDVSLIDEDKVRSTFIDNQETKRFVRVAKENLYYPPARLKLALTYLYTSPGMPIVYYGTEIALDGGGVPDNRRLMNFKTDEKFLQYVTKLGELRQRMPSLRRGTFELLYDKDGMSVLKRTYKDETALIAINNTKETQKVSFSANEVGDNRELRGLLEDEIIREEDGKYYIVLKRETANVYKAQEQTGINWLFVSIMVGINVLFITFLMTVKKKKKSSK